MVIANSLFYMFSSVLIFSALMVVFVQNSIYSVLFLVLCFASSASLLFLLECEFMALMFLIIYVGAIAVLFLFVVMMLDIKMLNSNKNFLKYFPFGSLVGFVFLLEVVSVITENFLENPYVGSSVFNYYFNWYDSVDSFNEIEAIGQVMYTKYVLQFLIAGNILLLATLGAVVLTLNTKNYQLSKKQIIFKQLSRNSKNVLLK